MARISGVYNADSDEYDPKLCQLKDQLKKLEERLSVPSSWDTIKKKAYKKKDKKDPEPTYKPIISAASQELVSPMPKKANINMMGKLGNML